ncbi:hypothetical protein [Streptomyces sp. NPDC029554]|uniref:hypothetical protein n=1 Tax=Streptomyces sp. NPDC029554 TaxID=3155126 RepID=UPI0033C06DE1
MASFHTAPQTSSGVQVTGVGLAGGEHLTADLVVVAGGRSALSAQVPGLHDAPRTDRNDPGFRYYTRHFRRSDGNLPEPAPWPLRHHAGVSVIVVPGDSGTWSTTLVTSGADQQLRGLGRADTWQRVAELYPGLAPWIQGEPVGEVVTMGGLRSSRPPLARTARTPLSGLVMLGDAWATTNPQFGLGISLGLLHARLLRDVLRAQDRPTALTASFQSNMEQLTPLYLGLSEWEAHRQAEIQADMRGSIYRTPDPAWKQHLAGRFAGMHDADVMRGLADIGFLLADARKVMQRPGLLARLSQVAAQAPSQPEGPSRRTVLAAAELRAA